MTDVFRIFGCFCSQSFSVCRNKETACVCPREEGIYPRDKDSVYHLIHKTVLPETHTEKERSKVVGIREGNQQIV